MGHEEKDKTYQIPIALNNRSEIPVIMVSFGKKKEKKRSTLLSFSSLIFGGKYLFSSYREIIVISHHINHSSMFVSVLMTEHPVGQTSPGLFT